ncbi:MAG: alginate export family protein [Thermodesulfobacteriota bacterium]
MIKKGWLLFLALLMSAGFVGTSYAADVTLSGQVRLRPEYRDNADFNDNADDTKSWVGQRTRLTANAKVSDDVSAKITLQDTRNWGTEGSTANTGGEAQSVDLKEGYLQLGNLFDTGLTLRAGRQKISKGDQRILGGLEWSNSARSFDAFALVHGSDAATVTAAWVKVTDRNSATGRTADDDTDLWAAYAELKMIPNNQLDLYAILLRDAFRGDGNKVKSLYTVGLRLAGKVENAGVDYTLEIPVQFGDTGTQLGGADGSYGGYAVFAKAGYTIPGENKIRIGVEYNNTSGDDNATDSDSDAYVNLGLGTDHAHYGYMDINNPSTADGNSGKTLYNLNVKANATPELSLYAAYWIATLNEVASGAKDDNGAELNLQAAYKLAAGTKLVAGYGHYFAGDVQDAASASGSADDQDWAFAMFITNF